MFAVAKRTRTSKWKCFDCSAVSQSQQSVPLEATNGSKPNDPRRKRTTQFQHGNSSAIEQINRWFDYNSTVNQRDLLFYANEAAGYATQPQTNDLTCGTIYTTLQGLSFRWMNIQWRGFVGFTHVMNLTKHGLGDRTTRLEFAYKWLWFVGFIELNCVKQVSGHVLVHSALKWTSRPRDNLDFTNVIFKWIGDQMNATIESFSRV